MGQPKKKVHEDNQSPARYELDYAVEIGESHLTVLGNLEAQLRDAGIDEESAHIPDLHKAIGLGKRLLSSLKEEAAAPASPTIQHQAKFKLDFSLPKYGGDLLAWPEFWEIFEASVDKNRAYPPVQKFYYLRRHLDGAAARAIQGLQLTADNYQEAVKILKDRFGKKDLRKDTLIAKLLSLPGEADAGNLKSLRKLVDEVTAGIRSLEALHAPNIGEVLLPVLNGKIPASWRLLWARSRREQTGDQDGEFKAFLRFLQQELECQEESVQVPCSKTHPEVSQPASKATTSVFNAQRVNAPQKSTWSCFICKEGQHRLDRCAQYQAMNVDDRWTMVRRVGACFQCLGRHYIRDCRSGTCRLCQRPHHTSLHRSLPTSSSEITAPRSSPLGRTTGQQPVTQPAPPGLQPPQTDRHADARGTTSDSRAALPPPSWRFNAQSAQQPQQCYMQTALVEGRGPHNTRALRVLLDGGSDASYIRKSVAEEMGLSVIGSGTFACVGFQERAEEQRIYQRVKIDLQSRHGGEAREFDLWCSDRLCAPLPPVDPPVKEAEGFVLADDFSGGQIDILSDDGADQFYRAVLLDCVVLGERLRALDTIFGYVLHGLDSAANQPPRHTYHCRQVEQMWDLDTIGIAADTETVEKELPEPTWNEEENRYEMGLLWSSDQRPVSNRPASSARTSRMMEKLDDVKLQEYNNNIVKLHQDAVIEPSPPSNNTTSAFFLPHRGLHRNDKLRIVFDGSAKDGAGVSLNTYLKPGDNLLRRLVAVLLGFRTHPVACQADIKAAFHQISVKKEDRPYLQFLWQEQALRFRRVPFGLTCSPYMLLRSIEKHLAQYQHVYPELCKKLTSGLYMDDVAVGFQSKEEAGEQMKVVQNMFQEAGMDMHKVRMTGQLSEDSKILGMMWNTGNDTLSVIIPAAHSPVTKSQLLSVISRPFDPLGVLSPWVIRGKILFQQTWTEAGCSSWDSALPSGIASQVEKWWGATKTIQRVDFPRVVGNLCEDDASSNAYCASIYIVHGGESRLFITKAQLAPLRLGITMPGMDLRAALIGTQEDRTSTAGAQAVDERVSDDAEKVKKSSTPTRCRTSMTFRVDADSEPPDDIGPFPLTDCSTLKKAVNRTAWMRRFIRNSRHRREDQITGL